MASRRFPYCCFVCMFTLTLMCGFLLCCAERSPPLPPPAAADTRNAAAAAATTTNNNNHDDDDHDHDPRPRPRPRPQHQQQQQQQQQQQHSTQTRGALCSGQRELMHVLGTDGLQREQNTSLCELAGVDSTRTEAFATTAVTLYRKRN